MCRRGTIFRRLQDVTDNMLRSPSKYGSIAISFARAITSTIHFWQSHIQQSYSPTMEGILSLESTFRDIDESLFELARLCSCVHPRVTALIIGFTYSKIQTDPFSCCRRRIINKHVRYGIIFRLPHSIPFTSFEPCSVEKHVICLPRVTGILDGISISSTRIQ
jgi:hypothetical protein